MDYQTRIQEIDRQLYRNNQFIRALEARVPTTDPLNGDLDNLVAQIQQLQDMNLEIAQEKVRLMLK